VKLSRKECCVLNSGSGSWAFEPLANQLSAALNIDVSDKPRSFNYLLQTEDSTVLDSCSSFIPIEAIRFASDKRLLAVVFNEHKIPTPQTILFENFNDARDFFHANRTRNWCLKYPTSCGASGHMMLSDDSNAPPNWPRPYIVQEFVQMTRPEVYRTYCAGGEMFGWVARRFPEGSKPSPWVAHARGARYVKLPEAPLKALEAAKPALVATKLWNSFGCVDLLCTPTGEWVVLEVGTDGLFNHVDRDIGDPDLEREMDQRIALAFWRAAVEK